MCYSTGCLTGGHSSWGECVRDKNVRNQWLGGTGPSFTEQKRWSNTNEAYRKAKREGLQPQAVSPGAINKAYDVAGGGS